MGKERRIKIKRHLLLGSEEHRTLYTACGQPLKEKWPDGDWRVGYYSDAVRLDRFAAYARRFPKQFVCLVCARAAKRGATAKR